MITKSIGLLRSNGNHSAVCQRRQAGVGMAERSGSGTGTGSLYRHVPVDGRRRDDRGSHPGARVRLRTCRVVGLVKKGCPGRCGMLVDAQSLNCATGVHSQSPLSLRRYCLAHPIPLFDLGRCLTLRGGVRLLCDMTGPSTPHTHSDVARVEASVGSSPPQQTLSPDAHAPAHNP